MIYIVMDVYFNGEYDSRRAHKAFKNEADADAYAADHNGKRTSSYDSTYEVEEVEMVE